MPITTPICVGVAMDVIKNPALFKSLDPALTLILLKILCFYNIMPRFVVHSHINNRPLVN